MSDTQRRINRWLKEQGFRIIRQKGKHRLWSDGKVVTTVPKSTSDHRAFENKKHEIKRLRRLWELKVAGQAKAC